MQLRFTQMLAALRQAQNFLDTNTERLGTLNKGPARADLDAVTNQLAALGAEQAARRIGSMGELVNEKRLARTLRRRNMRPIVKAAKRRVPEAAQLTAVRLPPLRSNSTELATKARAMADALVPHIAEMVAAGLDGDFVDELRGATDRLVAAITAKNDHRVRRIGASAAILKEVRAAKQMVDLVDARVRAALDEDDPLVTEWKAACRTIRRAVPQTQPDTQAIPAVPRAV